MAFWTFKEDLNRQSNLIQKQVFDELRTEQKFTPIYSPQCNSRIEGFRKFLKATIAKHLENHVEWDNLVWKATAAYNFFPTESSGITPFFLMFGREAAVKHTLLASESPKYLGTDDGMINVELMSKLYLVVAHNLNEARKARDGNKQKKNTRKPEKIMFLTCYVIFYYLYVTVSLFYSPVDLSAPGASLRPLALVMLNCDTVKALGTGNIICKWQLPGP